MMRRSVLPLIVLLLLAGAAGWWFYQKTHPSADASHMGFIPPVTVSAAPAAAETWRDEIHVVGSIRAVQGVDVTTELSGIVHAIRFQSGGQVSAGDILLQLDTTADEAQLQGFQAQVALAEVQLARSQKLVQTQAVSRAALDQAQAQYKQAVANVAYQQALIQKKNIRAPFSGQLGIRQVDLGQYLSPGTAIVTLQALDPVRVEFTLPQQDLSRVAEKQPLAVRVDTYPGRNFPGTITAISSRGDAQTRNFSIEGTLANLDHTLRPGMFVTVAVLMPAQRRVITLPQTAINFSPYGDSVFVVTEAAPAAGATPVAGAPGRAAEAALPPPAQQVAHQRFIKLGATRGDQIEILDGLKSGEVVVTSGQFKLRDGATVVINNQVQPGNDPAPQPDNS